MQQLLYGASESEVVRFHGTQFFFFQRIFVIVEKNGNSLPPEEAVDVPCAPGFRFSGLQQPASQQCKEERSRFFCWSLGNA